MIVFRVISLRLFTRSLGDKVLKNAENKFIDEID